LWRFVDVLTTLFAKRRKGGGGGRGGGKTAFVILNFFWGKEKGKGRERRMKRQAVFTRLND